MNSFCFEAKGDVTEGTLTISNLSGTSNTLNLTNVRNGGGVITGFKSVTIDDDLIVDYAIKVGTTNVTNINADNVLDEDVATVSYDCETNTLKLNNAILGNSDAASNIVVNNQGILNLEISGTNTIEGGS